MHNIKRWGERERRERSERDLKVYYAIMTNVRSSNWLNDDDDGIGLVWPFAPLLLILLHVPCLYYLGALLFHFFYSILASFNY